MSRTTRRDFVKASTILSIAGLVPWYSTSVKAEEKPRLKMGCIGVGSQGAGNALSFNPLFDIVAVSDLDEDYRIGKLLAAKALGPKKGNDVRIPDFYKDYRRLLDQKDIDAVCIATPDHWHVKIAIEALQAGKHVYCQKPLTLTLEENILIRKAVAKYGKIFQVGTQRRTQTNEFLLAALIVRGGHLGKIRRVICNLNEGRKSLALQKYPLPGKLDWNMFVGQAPMRDYIASSAEPGKKWGGLNLPDQSNGLLTFRWWHDFAGGKFTDWGAHYIDAALWALNRQTIGSGPVSVDASGSEFLVPYKDGKPTIDNIYNTAVKFNVKCLFADGLELLVTSEGPDGDGVLFEGEKGRVHVNCGRIKGKLIEQGIKQEFKPEDYEKMYNGKPVESHWQNFLRCCLEGGTPISDVPSHVLAMNVCHLCGISSRINRPIQWDPTAEKIVGDDLAESFFSYKQRKGFELPTVD